MAADIKKFAFNPFTGNLDVTQDVTDMVDGPATATDDAVVRYDGTTGKLTKDSGVLISDSDEISGAARLDVDNLRLDGNTLSITDTDGDLNLDANGTGNINANFPLILSQDGVAALEAVTKQQLDASVSGVDVKEGVLVATTADITLSGEQTIDGVLTSTSRVLVKNQAAPADNGIYISAAGAWSRSTDADTGPELENALVTVQQGSTQANTGWYQTADSINLGVTNIVFVQFFGAGTYTADGQGIELSGSTFSLELDGTSLSKSSSGLRVAANGVTGSMLRLANDEYLRGRNQADNGDINIIKVNTGDTLTIGASAQPAADGTLDLGSTGNNWLSLNSRALASNAALAITSTTTMAITSTSGLTVKTADSASAASASASYRTGDVSSTSNGGTGNLNCLSGAKSGSGNGETGTWTGGSGANSANSGDDTGNVLLESGAKSVGTASSGTVTVRTGSATDNSGAAFIRSGNSSGGSSGNVSIITGTAAGTRGDVILDGLKVDVSATRITNMAAPTAASDAATRAYADMTSTNVNGDVTLARNTIALVSTAAARILTLPAPAEDIRIWVKDRTGSAEANTITVNPNAAETIDGASSYVINSNYGAVLFISDGTNWFLL